MRKSSPAELTLEQKFAERERLIGTNPDILRSTHHIYHGDAREMREIERDPVHLVITSPPYWNLKEYDGAAGETQLGHLEDYDNFVAELSRVWQRCYDLLLPGGRLCVVVGDVCVSRRKAGRHYVVPLHADISRSCMNIGFDYLTPILWYKIANARTEVQGNGSTFLGKPYEPNGIIKNDVEYILLFRKPGGYRAPSFEQRVLSLIDKKDHSKWFRAIWDDIAGSNRLRGHPAPFPEEIAYRLIRMFSFVGDTILDPFVGTGSTSKAAMRAARSSVGYEIEPAYIEIMRQRFRQVEHNIQLSMPDVLQNRL